MASRQSPRNGRALSSMSGTYRGLSVNDHFRSNSRLKQNENAGPGIRARAFNNTGLYSGVSSKGTSAVKPPLRNSRMENSSATKSIQTFTNGPNSRLVRNTSTSSIKLNSRELPALKSQKNRL